MKAEESLMEKLAIKAKCPFIRKCLRKVSLSYFKCVCCTILHTTCIEYQKRTKGEKTPADWEDTVG